MPPNAVTDTCLVLMFKAPERSKFRLAADIGPLATAAAALLLECAAEDLTDWPGSVCLAPASPGDEAALDALPRGALVVQQGEGNLGARLNRVNAELLGLGIDRQVFIGIDCPALDRGYLASAAGELDRYDAVFGPADDGGAVVIGARGLLPNLSGLPWSSDRLLATLEQLLRRVGLATSRLPVKLADVDSIEDLRAVRPTLADDERATRRALCSWVDEHAAEIDNPGHA